MRVDPQDREDILFLSNQHDFDRVEFKQCIEHAVIPEVPEIIEAFRENAKWLEGTL